MLDVRLAPYGIAVVVEGDTVWLAHGEGQRFKAIGLSQEDAVKFADSFETELEVKQQKERMKIVGVLTGQARRESPNASVELIREILLEKFK